MRILYRPVLAVKHERAWPADAAREQPGDLMRTCPDMPCASTDQALLLACRQGMHLELCRLDMKPSIQLMQRLKRGNQAQADVTAGSINLQRLKRDSLALADTTAVSVSREGNIYV